METKMAKDLIEFQKAAFDNTFSAITMMQDQAERATKMFLETSMMPIPEEGKKILDEWVQAFKRGREEFKRAVDESYRKMEESFTMAGFREEAGESESGEESEGSQGQTRRPSRAKPERRTE